MAWLAKLLLSVASAILEKDPAPITAAKPFAPRSLDHVIRRCLAKDPDERWQTARDLALELKSILTEDSGNQAVQRRGNTYVWVALCFTGFLAVLAILLRHSLRIEESLASRDYPAPILPPEGMELTAGLRPQFLRTGSILCFRP